MLIYNEGEISRRKVAQSQLLPHPPATSSSPGFPPLLCPFLCVLFYDLKGEKYDLPIQEYRITWDWNSLGFPGFGPPDLCLDSHPQVLCASDLKGSP